MGSQDAEDVEAAAAGMEVVEEDSFLDAEEGRGEEDNLAMDALRAFQAILGGDIRRGTRTVAAEV